MMQEVASGPVVKAFLLSFALSKGIISLEWDGIESCLAADGCSPESPQHALLQITQNRVAKSNMNPSGAAAPLTADGYSAVADRCCQAEMEQFISRVAFDLGVDVCNDAGIKGIAPYHTCEKGPQSYDALSANLLADVAERCSAFALKGKCGDLPADCPAYPIVSTPNCHCSASGAAKLDFKKAFMGQNNLGGLGPDTGIEEMRYINIFAMPFPVRWSTHPNICIDVKGGTYANGATVVTYECVNDGTHFNMQWTLPPSGTGVIRWTPHPDKCFQVAGGSTANGANLELWDCDESNPNQQFITPASGDGLIKWATNPNKCVEVDGGKTTNHANLQMFDCSDSNPNMQWTLPAVSDATDLVVTALSDYVSDGNADIETHKAKGFGALSVRKGTSTDFQFQFVESGTSTPRIIEEFHMAFEDIDKTAEGDDSISGSGYKGYITDPATTLVASALSSGRTKFSGTAVDVPDPSAPRAATSSQIRATVMYFFEKASTFQVTLGFDASAGRSLGAGENSLFLFSGTCGLDDMCAK